MADLTAEVAESHRKAPHQVPGPPPSPRKDLGGAGSGHHGHEGVPGQRGGSAPGKGGGSSSTGGGGVTMRTPTKEDRDWIDKNTSHDIEQIGDKPDGGKFLISQPYGVAEWKQKLAESVTSVLGAEKAQIAVAMMSGLPDDVRVGFAIGKNENYPDAEVLDMFVESDAKGAAAPIRLGRQFIRHKDGTLTVHHDSFMVPRTLQGKGLAKTILADSMEVYKQLGVTEVTTIANDSRGAYAWAKFGFKATDPPALAAKLTDRVTKAGNGQLSPVLPDATDAQKASIQAVIDAHKDDPRLPWHIAGIVTADGQAIGKQLLWEMDWNAKLDLNDEESMDRLHHYVTK